MCVRCYLELLMGYIVLRNIFPAALRLSEASKMSQNHFPLCCGSEVPWKLPQIFMLDKHWCTEVLLAPVQEPVPQKEMTLCHAGATRIYTPVPGTSNKHNSNRSRAWRKASFVLRHPCPPLTYLWKPRSHGSFQTAFTPAPTSALMHMHTPTHPKHSYLSNSETLGVAVFITHQNSFLLSEFKTNKQTKKKTETGPSSMVLPSRSSGLVRSITLWPILPSSPSLPRWCPMLSKCALSCRETQTVRYTNKHIHARLYSERIVKKRRKKK